MWLTAQTNPQYNLVLHVVYSSQPQIQPLKKKGCRMVHVFLYNRSNLVRYKNMRLFKLTNQSKIKGRSIYCVHNLRHIRPLSNDTFLVKDSLH